MSNCDDKDENQMEVDIEDKAQVLDQKEAVLVDDDEEDKGNDSSSDIEIEGVDQEGINDVSMEVKSEIMAGEVEDDNTIGKTKLTEKDDDETAKKFDKMAKMEAKELDAAREESTELLSAIRKNVDPSLVDGTVGASRLTYLLAQSEVFAHFLAGSVSASKKKGKSKGNRGKAGRLTEAEEDAQLLKSAQSKRRTIRLDKQPSNLAPICKMRAYQLEGLNWLIKLHDHGINGILADEMGLGKTLQTISLLAYLREARGVAGPHLVIVPKSVVGNWIREFKKWCPVIRAIRMGGGKDERKQIVDTEFPKDPSKDRCGFDVLVTSYEGVLKEKGKLSKFPWKYLIIDEAHRIKNEESSLSKVVRVMNAEHRVLITGTPLQNNLHELWALLNFLMPDIFGDAEAFDEWFSMEGEEGKENVIRRLHTVLRPFMIRRVKKDVARDLPPKKETKLYVGLTDMQIEWYKKILRKDAHSLNALGGPDRVRLLNILMQLRKVCNHPYLFDGAEAGPPYSDGPHLWENCGKLNLLHRLLIKLKAKGSRILIFSQMTRVLDILEDYLRLVGHEYCRIDGSTDGEKRDSQMDTFNAPGSSKFCFLLSTRAGGLGINLATADIVILYDSDWNPQVDLQAMDRAHRIGQTKPVQVFRFLTEGTVEEKIIERAERKLFLDAAVIQQGRLAEQHASVNKDELMKMVRFGADQILSKKGATITDEDIDALIAKGEERTASMQAKLKTDAQHNLASFSLMGDDEGTDTFDFAGENYRGADSGAKGNFINLPQRERKRNYDVNVYFRETMSSGSGPAHGSGVMKAHAADAAAKKRKKGPNYQDFQLFDKERLEYFHAKEKELGVLKEERLNVISAMRSRARNAPSINNPRTIMRPGQETSENLNEEADELEKTLNNYNLSNEEQKEKGKLLAEGFPDWNRKDFRAFCSSIERHGRYAIPKILKDVCAECGKDENDVKRYFVCFWLNYRRTNDWKKVLDKMERGEKKILRLRQIRDSIDERVERHLVNCCAYLPIQSTTSGSGKPTHPSPAKLLDYCWPSLRLNYGAGTKNRAYTEEEDAFLLCMMHRHGYGAADRIRLEIRRAWQFRFDWYFKSRNSQEIQKRCDVIIKIIEKENDDYRKKEEIFKLADREKGRKDKETERNDKASKEMDLRIEQDQRNQDKARKQQQQVQQQVIPQQQQIQRNIIGQVQHTGYQEHLPIQQPQVQQQQMQRDMHQVPVQQVQLHQKQQQVRQPHGPQG